MERMGIYSTQERLGLFNEVLDGRYIDYKDTRAIPCSVALASWQNAGFDMCIIDDAAVVDVEEMEEAILEHAATATSPAVRVIFVASETRAPNDTFFFQLVSTADIKDLVVPSCGQTISTTLPLRVAAPATLMDVSSWKTNDRKKLVRRKKREGLFGIFDRARENKEQRQIANDNAPESMPITQPELYSVTESIPITQEQPYEQLTQEQTPFGVLQPDYGICPSCGAAVLAPGQQYCATCTAPLIAQPESNQPVVDIVNQYPLTTEAPTMQENTDVKPALEAPAQAPEEPKPTLAEVEAAIQPAPVLGASLRVEGHVELSTPSARSIVAVGSLRHGCGCTHLTIALAMELARKNVAVSVAIYDNATYDDMRRTLAPQTTPGCPFEFAGIDFYRWNEQRKHAEKYECVVCDCGIVDYPDDDPNSSAALFSRAGVPVMILSGAPWDIPVVEDYIGKLDGRRISEISWMFYSTPRPLIEEIVLALGERSSGAVTADYVPYRFDMFKGDRSQYARYSHVLDQVMKTIGRL